MKEKPSICFGGITHGFVHAVQTENFLDGKCLSDPMTLDGALKTLSEELNPHSDLLEAEPIYRKNLAQGLLYKTILGIVCEILDDRTKSGATNFARFKEVSNGQQFFKSDTELWPMNQAIPKIEG